MKTIDRLIERIKQTNSVLCVGVDPQDSLFTTKIKEISETIQQYRKFCFDIIDSVYDIVPCMKFNIAFFETIGPEGLALYKDILEYASDKGLITIADIKRGDIGSTSEAYAKAFLEIGAPFESDFITINGYFGIDGIKPFMDLANKNEKGIFVLVKTSNPSSSEIQDLKIEGTNKAIYEKMGELVESWGENSIGDNAYSSMGAVIGATHKEQLREMRKKHDKMFFLVPGFGAQGGDANDIKYAFDQKGLGAIINSTRGITGKPASIEKNEKRIIDDEEFRKIIIAEVNDNNKKLNEAITK
ncbi:MAG TPA: orotidine-5'-phosphate decarboxylase [Clostridiales bacterium]|nr:MAG: orotidine 5'-phosphate decarboxylase [Clostridiales bacterium GWD2_32_19]HCC08216.1 orotidine-5'-phosphate decarboxylase [Clostridiales bacterium]